MLNIQELTERYNLKNTQTIRKFITRNLEKINENGTHAFHDLSNGWQFDETAVRIIDKLRGISEVAIIERDESEQVQELKDEVENLKNMLLMTQNKLLQKQEELSQAEKKYLSAENISNVEELKRKHLEEKLSVAESQLSEVRSQLKNLQIENDKLKKRGLVGRIFNNL